MCGVTSLPAQKSRVPLNPEVSLFSVLSILCFACSFHVCGIFLFPFTIGGLVTG